MQRELLRHTEMCLITKPLTILMIKPIPVCHVHKKHPVFGKDEVLYDVDKALFLEKHQIPSINNIRLGLLLLTPQYYNSKS